MNNTTQFTMRMDNCLYEKLKARAERNRRSITKELECIVEQQLMQDNEEFDRCFGRVWEYLRENQDKDFTEIKQDIKDTNLRSFFKPL